MNEEFDNSVIDELGIDSAKIAEISKKVAELKKNNEGVSAIFPIVVEGRPDFEEKPHYIGYFCQPSFKTFSKYLVASQQNQAGAMRTLARDCFLDGDKELVDNDSLFLFGLMGQLSKIIEMRNGALINLSKTGK